MLDEIFRGKESPKERQLAERLERLDKWQKQLEEQRHEVLRQTKERLKPVTEVLKQAYKELINPGNADLIAHGSRVHRKLTDNGDGTYGLFFQDEGQLPSKTTIRMCLVNEPTDYLGYFGYGLTESPYVVIHYDSSGEPVGLLVFDTTKMKQDQKTNKGNHLSQWNYASRYKIIPDWDPSGTETDRVLNILSPIVKAFNKPKISPEKPVEESARLPSFTL